MGRLERHAEEFRGRHGLDLAKAECTFVVLPPPWDVRTSEELLISHYTGQSLAPWNYKGFGSNDPGRKRDHTAQSWFHTHFPARRDFPIEVEATSVQTVATVLRKVKDQLPFLLRYQKKLEDGEPGWDQDLARPYTLGAYAGPVEPFLVEVCQKFMATWQLTYLGLGYILYKERASYPAGTIIVYQRP